MKALTFFLLILGLSLLTGIMAWLGVGHVLDAMQRVGYSGFAFIVIAQIGVDFGLGLAWAAACPSLGLYRAIGARAVRDAAANCLPFSQLGGMALGVRATCRQPDTRRAKDAIHWTQAVATNIVDVTTEVLGQILFIMIAFLCLIGQDGAKQFLWPVVGGIGILAIGVAGFIWTQHRSSATIHRICAFLGRHITAGWRDSLSINIDSFQAHLETLWSRPQRIGYGAGLHFLCWLGGAATTWLSYCLLGAHISYLDAIAIEGVVCGVMSASFLVPANLGVQEAAYVALGLLFGVEAEISLGLSLLRRGRDLIIGIPVIATWQIHEALARRRKKSDQT